VIPADWDEEGDAIAVAVSSLDEQEYFIERDEKGKELLQLMQQEVEVSGTVRKATRGHKIIRVKSYGLKTGGDWRI